jgi:hypothetical protein
MLATSRSDIVISIQPQHLPNIISRQKNHEFRKYALPDSVKHMWIYETRPTSALTHVATIGPTRRPGDITDEHGLNNQAFNNGIHPAGALYACEIFRLDKLDQPIALTELVAEKWLGGPPQKYCFARKLMLEAMNKRAMTMLFATECSVGATNVVAEDELCAAD